MLNVQVNVNVKQLEKSNYLCATEIQNFPKKKGFQQTKLGTCGGNTYPPDIKRYCLPRKMSKTKTNC